MTADPNVISKNGAISKPAIALLLLYLLTMVVNGIVGSGKGVRLMNKDLSFAHPVYLTPPPFAFAIWGVIYLLLGAFVIMQALPAYSQGPLEPLRPWAAIAFTLNASWLFLFGQELFWLSFVVIVAYMLTLFKLVSLVGLDLADGAAPDYLARLVAQCAFSANASWVTVATLLQLQINLLDEGYFPSVDLSIAFLVLAVALGAWRAFVAADAPWALACAWAFNAIRSNQLKGSDWGCLLKICEACKAGAQRICANGRASPLGWAAVCNAKRSVTPLNSCMITRSDAVAVTCLLGICAVALALAAGVLRGYLAATCKQRTDTPVKTNKAATAGAYRGM
ncbi:hypothetical protein T492DRAFT_1082364 [Pavlovales sp. CCMP2436]|nr:hypothetical protein T492DRAFT_1082364 [Pavlovales sp. CCMP2436]